MAADEDPSKKRDMVLNLVPTSKQVVLRVSPLGYPDSLDEDLRRSLVGIFGKKKKAGDGPKKNLDDSAIKDHPEGFRINDTRLIACDNGIQKAVIRAFTADSSIIHAYFRQGPNLLLSDDTYEINTAAFLGFKLRDHVTIDNIRILVRSVYDGLVSGAGQTSAQKGSYDYDQYRFGLNKITPPDIPTSYGEPFEGVSGGYSYGAEVNVKNGDKYQKGRICGRLKRVDGKALSLQVFLVDVDGEITLHRSSALDAMGNASELYVTKNIAIKMPYGDELGLSRVLKIDGETVMVSNPQAIFGPEPSRFYRPAHIIRIDDEDLAKFQLGDCVCSDDGTQATICEFRYLGQGQHSIGPRPTEIPSIEARVVTLDEQGKVVDEKWVAYEDLVAVI